MFDDDAPKEERSADWTGTIIAVAMWPVLLVFMFMGNGELGFTTCIVLGLSIYAIRLRWELRKHVWFWGTIVLILALHIPLLFIVRWPETNVPTIAYSLPFGIVDFALIIGGLSLAQRIFSKGPSSDDNNG